MRKFYSCFILLMTLGTVSLHARQLTPEQALARALGDGVAPASAVSRSGGMSLSYTAKDSATDRAGVYVFNASDNAGYLVVSADDVALPVLGYSDSGSFDPSAIPSNMKAWLGEYAREIAWASARSASSPVAYASSISHPVGAISPLCKTKWSQDAPFNNQCPELNGERCVTGCVATAMAQVMKYHNYPAKGTGSHSYTTSTAGLNVSFDFGSTTFDWGNMLDTYTAGAYNDAQASAVATLMKAAGVSVNMNYTTQSSGAISMAPVYAFINYFGYDKGVSYQKREWYGLYEWEHLIYDNLKNVGPVIFGAQSISGGHEFVCDGYTQDGYFHINWGWGGMSDGNFRLTALDPGAQGIGGGSGGYNFDQDVILGIQKPTSRNETTPVVVSGADVSGSKNGNVLTLTGKFYNFSLAVLNNVTLGAQVMGSDGNTQYFSGGVINSMSSVNLENGSYPYAPSYSVTLSDLPAGTYEVRPAFKVGDGEWQLMKSDITSISNLVVTIGSNGNITALSQPSDAAVNLSVSDVKVLTKVVPGSMFRVSAKVVNGSSQEFFGAIGIIMVQNGANILLTKSALDIPAGDATEIDLQPIMGNVDPGEYKLRFARVSGNAITAYIGEEFPVTVEAYETPALGMSFTIDNADAVTLDNITFNLTVNNSGGYYYGPVRAVIFPYASGAVSSLGAISSGNLEIKAHTDDQKFTFSGAFPQGVVGNKYLVLMYVGDKKMTEFAPDKYFQVSATTGIDDIYSDEEVRSLEVYNVSGMRIPVPSGVLSMESLGGTDLPAGIYIVVRIYASGHRSTVKYVKQ